MFVDYRQISTIDNAQARKLINGCKFVKHKAIVILMLDAGLRVTEVVSLKWENILFGNQQIIVKSLKKRGKEVYRSIPMTSRILDILSEHYSSIKDRSNDKYLFPSRTTKTGHMCRKSVWKMIKTYTGGKAYPHMLRHTFVSKIVNEGGDIHVAKELAGHASVRTTEIYTHSTVEAKRKTIDLLEPKGLVAKLRQLIKPTKRVFKIERFSDFSTFHVGRKNEIKTIENYANRKINTIILGNQGIGKSHLLSRLSGDLVVRLDDMSSVKQSLGELLLQLHKGDKQAVIDALTDKANVQRILSKSSVKRLTELLCQVTQPQEYTILIDDLSNITKQGVIVLEHLKNHFHILAAARQIKLSHSSFLTNFEKVKLNGISRAETASLIGHHARHMYDRIEDWEIFVNHIWEHSNGNPLYAIELCKRFEKEPVLDIYTIRNISHTDAVKEIDVSTGVVIALSSLMVLRYIGGEFGADQSGAFRLFGGIFFVIAIFARSIFNYTKRKTV